MAFRVKRGRLELQVGAMVRQIIVTGLVVFLPTSVLAQGRGMMPSAPHAVAVAPRGTMPVSHGGMAPVAPAMRIVARGGGARPRAGTPIARNGQRPIGTRRHNRADEIGLRADCGSAPGLGFDAVHQAATCGPGSVGSRIRGGQVPLFFPFFGGGFFLPGSAAATEESATADNSQPEDTDAEARENHRRYRTSQTAAAAPVTRAEEAGPAQPDTEEFVFVRRDGTLFFAVAYAWENGTLRYVTSEGLRHIVTLDALDLGATQQFNEQRGLNFRSPA